MAAGTAFYQAAEQLAIETLAVEEIDFVRFDEQVLVLSDHLGPIIRGPRVALDAGTLAASNDDAGGRWQIPFAHPAALGDIFHQLLSSYLSSRHAPLVAWATTGSGLVEPTCLITRGLPEPASFPAFLHGAWEGCGWRVVPARVNAEAIEPVSDAGGRTAVYLRSAAVSDVGCVREVNQDAFLERPDAGIWAVADGLGGHSHGEVASRMVCNALSALSSRGGIDELVSAAGERLHQVEEDLWRAMVDRPELDGSGSTVVALLARGGRCAIMWAGDSRAYRLRAGRLEQLTRDHAHASALAGGEETSVITRAVGGHPGQGVDLDVVWDGVRIGDRFLLCSDGLSRVLSQDTLRGELEVPNIRAGVESLVRKTLEAGGPDNVTAVIVEAYGDETT
jgi:type VI secretion system protein ImpM